MARGSYIWFVACLFLVSFFVPRANGEVLQQCKRPLFGITFTHYRVDTRAQCANGRDSARVLAEGAIIPNYDKVDVRQEVQRDLAQIKRGGFNMVRTVLWFTQDKIIAPWGQLHAPLNAADAQRILEFGRDVRSAGFEKWLIVTNPGIRNNPACRIKVWGDCYEPSREAANFDFIRAVHELLAPLGTGKFRIEYDLSGELCPSQWLTPLANANIKTYVTDLIRWYSTEVSKTDFHISCGGLASDRTALLLSIFDGAGVKPNEIDIHLYDTDPNVIAKKVLPAAPMARQRHIPLVIGEMQYENPAEVSAIRALAARYGICFSEIIEWPLRGQSMCQINVQPPFSSQLLQSIVPP